MIHASLVAHMAERYMQQQVKVYGTTGSLEIDVVYKETAEGVGVHIARQDDQQFQTLEVPASYWGDASRSQPFEVVTRKPVGCREFVDAILESRPVTPTFYDGYKAQQVIEAAMKSYGTGR